MSGGPYILNPLVIVPSMIRAGTSIPEPDPSREEVAWVPNVANAVGKVVVSDGYLWTCSLAHNGRNKPPAQDDAKYWQRGEPSNRQAPFDNYRSTPAKAVGSITYVLQPGFFSDAILHGVVADRVVMDVTEGEGGPSMLEEPLDVDMWEQALGLWELLFNPLGMRDQVSLDDIPVHPMATITVTASSIDAAAPVAIGTIMLGEWRSLIGDAQNGGVEYGAEAEPKSYSYIKFDLDGKWTIVKRPTAVNLRLPTVLNAAQADFAMALLREVQDVPVAIRATNAPGYDYLSTVGLVTGPLSASNFSDTRANIKVTGAI